MPRWTLLILSLQVYSTVTGSLPYVCHPGNYLHTPRVGPDVCLHCPEGVGFMPERLHRHRQCYNCTQVLDPRVEVVVSVCNRTHDSVILCREGYYRRVARNVRELDMCVQCSLCDHVTRPCQGYHDAVCCLPSYEAVWNKHGFYECREHPIVCGAGEFLSLKTEQCTPCPPGSFMASDKHNNTNCQLCQTLDDVGPHQVIIQPCNETHLTQFACQDGFYRNTPIELKETYCLPCRTCEGEGGQCRRSHNSSKELICLFPEHITEESALVNHTGTSVRSPVCKDNECLSTHPDNNTSSCLPCPERTRLDDNSHANKLVSSNCKNTTLEVEAETKNPQVILPFISVMITLSVAMVIILLLLSMSRSIIIKVCFLASINRRTAMKLTLIYLFIFVNLSLLLSALLLSSVSRILAWINLAIVDVLFVIIVFVFYPRINKNKKAFHQNKFFLPEEKNNISAKYENEDNKIVEILFKGLKYEIE